MMKAAQCALVCVLLGVVQAQDVSRPVSKVIALLKDMSKQLQKEAEEDEAIYDKMACWCETNDKEKTKAIADAEARISQLTANIEEMTATSARLGTEIKNLDGEVQKNIEALDKATSIRQNELAKFNEEEKELLESVAALKAAITVLSKHHGGALVQVPHSHLLGVAATLQHEMQTHGRFLKGVFTPSQRRLIAGFVQQVPSGPPTFKRAYQAQSGEIFGILKQMQETFENNLSDSQKEELAAQKAYDELKAAKEKEIAAGKDQINTKTDEKADTDAKNAQAKQDVEDTTQSLSADEQFLMMLKEKCSMTDKEWEERQKTRQTEIEAVSQALAILSSDDSHDLFRRTFNPAFMQVESSDLRARAVAVLSTAAMKSQNPKLATLATRAQLDAFTKVKAAIDNMITQLLKEKDEEIKHKDFCVGEFNSVAQNTQDKNQQKTDVEGEIDGLESQIASLTKAIDDLNAQVANLRVELKKAGETREAENKEFQTTLSDQRETQTVVAEAMATLKRVYDASFMQTAKQAGPPPPAGFKTYEKNQAGKGVMSLMQQIIDDAKAMEAQTVQDEKDAQVAYEDFVKETNAVIEAKTTDIVNKSKNKADAEIALIKAKQDLDNVKIELEQLSNQNADLKNQCDFFIKNFDVRQTARDEEVEALRQAKAILSGAKFD